MCIRDRKSREFAEFLENYQRFKEIKKLLGTYVDKIPQVKEPKINAVYTTYNQYGAKTGRFSSSDTVSKINLQNIPSKEKRIRKIFKARDGYKPVSYTHLEDAFLLSKKLGKPVIMLAQANREAVKNKKKGQSPELHDLAESDGVAQNATRESPSQ